VEKAFSSPRGVRPKQLLRTFGEVVGRFLPAIWDALVEELSQPGRRGTLVEKGGVVWIGRVVKKEGRRTYVKRIVWEEGASPLLPAFQYAFSRVKEGSPEEELLLKAYRQYLRGIRRVASTVLEFREEEFLKDREALLARALEGFLQQLPGVWESTAHTTVVVVPPEIWDRAVKRLGL